LARIAYRQTLRATERATQTRRFAAGKSFLRETAEIHRWCRFPDKERDLKFIGNSRVVDGAGQVLLRRAALFLYLKVKNQNPDHNKRGEAIGSKSD
jgi:hypothetical protein